MKDAGITHILNVTPNEKDFFPKRCVYVCVCMCERDVCVECIYTPYVTCMYGVFTHE